MLLGKNRTARLASSVAALLLACCTSTTPPPPGEAAPAEPSAPPTRPGLAETELVWWRGEGGACGAWREIVVEADGDVAVQESEGCYMGRPGDPPPPPDSRRRVLTAAERATLAALLADPALASMAGDLRTKAGSAHPWVVEVAFRTPDGVRQVQYLGVDVPPALVVLNTMLTSS